MKKPNATVVARTTNLKIDELEAVTGGNPLALAVIGAALLADKDLRADVADAAYGLIQGIEEALSN